ncbi:hypothetical protein [Moraxella lacunata]
MQFILNFCKLSQTHFLRTKPCLPYETTLTHKDFWNIRWSIPTER